MTFLETLVDNAAAWDAGKGAWLAVARAEAAGASHWLTANRAMLATVATQGVLIRTLRPAMGSPLRPL